MTELGVTPSQTVGPFLHLGLEWADGPYVVPPSTPGALRVGGRVFDGVGDPVPDAMIETWQADPDGRFDHPDDPRGAAKSSVPGFRGFGRSTTDRLGRWWMLTVKPGLLPTREGEVEAPHLDISVFGRGMLDRVVTRLYFPDEVAANAVDPVLLSVDEGRRESLVAAESEDGLRFDIWLQGEHESVFFAV